MMTENGEKGRVVMNSWWHSRVCPKVEVQSSAPRFVLVVSKVNFHHSGRLRNGTETRGHKETLTTARGHSRWISGEEEV